MNKDKIKISELTEYKNNAKIHTKKQIRQIANSIEEFGFNDPIEIDENNMILSGHGRYQADENSFNFCFDGLPKFATLSISTIGVKRDSNAMKIWQAGVKEMLKRLQPMRLIVYGGKIEFDYGDTEVIYIENAVTERMKEGAS